MITSFKNTFYINGVFLCPHGLTNSPKVSKLYRLSNTNVCPKWGKQSESANLNLNCGFGLLILMGSSSFLWVFYNLLDETAVESKHLFRVKNVAYMNKKKYYLFLF